MYKHTEKLNRGITYIEIVLAIVIISFIIMVFARMFLTHTIAVTSARLHTMATNYASHRMEEIKSTPYFNVSTTTFTSGFHEGPAGSQDRFSSLVDIIEIDDGLKEVEVVVNWEDVDGPRSYRIVSFIADY